MDEFNNFYEMLKKDRKYSTWSGENTFESRLKELKGEVSEIEQGLANGDFENFKEEIGDSLWDLLFLVVIAQEKGLFDMSDVLSGAMEKLGRRKSWIFEKEIPDVKSQEEEVKIWDEVKKEEKRLGLR